MSHQHPATEKEGAQEERSEGGEEERRRGGREERRRGAERGRRGGEEQGSRERWGARRWRGGFKDRQQREKEREIEEQ